jgi:hypothetical protein
MCTVRIRHFACLSIYVDPGESINIQKTDCNDCVDFSIIAVQNDPWSKKHENTNDKPIVILFHYHSQLHIIFHPSTEPKSQRLNDDIDEHGASEWPLQIVHFWKSGLEKLHLSY